MGVVRKYTRLVIKIPIRVSILDAKTGETVSTSTFTRQGQLSDFVQLRIRENRENNVRFEAKVLYNRQQDYYNEFEFKTFKEFKEKLDGCLERELLKDLLKDKILPKEYVQGL